MNPTNKATLGVVLDTTGLAAEITVHGARLSVIGYVWEPTTELVAVDSDGAVWLCSPSRGSRVLLTRPSTHYAVSSTCSKSSSP